MNYKNIMWLFFCVSLHGSDEKLKKCKILFYHMAEYSFEDYKKYQEEYRQGQRLCGDESPLMTFFWDKLTEQTSLATPRQDIINIQPYILNNDDFELRGRSDVDNFLRIRNSIFCILNKKYELHLQLKENQSLWERCINHIMDRQVYRSFKVEIITDNQMKEVCCSLHYDKDVFKKDGIFTDKH